MKKTRRIAAFIAAMAMAATMAVPSMMTASAESQDVTVKVQTDGSIANEVTNIKPNADKVTHTYTAYQIFKGEYVQVADAVGTEGEDGYVPAKYEFKVTGLGSDAENLLSNTAFLAFKPANDKDSVGETIAKLPDGATDAQKAIAAAAALDGIQDDSDKAKELAAILANAATGTGKEITTAGVNLKEGYYVVKDDYTVNVTNDAVSRFILRVNAKKDANGITIIPKKSYPEVIKKVQENVKSVLSDWVGGTATTLESNVDTGENWNDVADYNIGDAVPFKLYGSMPVTLDDYEHYYYKFTDTLGVQFDQPETVTVNVGTETLTFTKSDASKYYTIDTTHQKTYTYTSTVGSEKTLAITNTDYNCRVTYENHVLKVWFEDVRAYGVTADSIVTVSYSAVLNEDAVIGLSGQENKVDLTYSNNPNFEYTPHTDTPDKPDLPESPDYPDTPDIPDSPDVPDKPDSPDTPDTPDTPQDKTPEDKVVVFTYEVDINKIDGDTKSPLQGAEFKLSKGTGADKKYVQVDSTGKVTGWTAAEADGSVLTSDDNGLFKVIGLDSGSYALTETKAPTGYNLPANPEFSVTLTATTVNTQKYTSDTYPNATKVLKDIAGKINTADMTKLDAGIGVRGVNGGLAGTIENNKGTTLPSTGGMGTKAFVAGGGLTALLAGVWLATKKRMGKED